MIVRKDIQIFVGNEISSVKKCPTTVVSNNPCFKWILPKDLEGKQTRFCLQIKAHTPHILSSGKRDYAFYQSGDVESRLNTFEINFGTTGLFLQSWSGAIAIRLFISTKTKNEVDDKKIPYEYVSDEEYVSNVSWENDLFDIKDDTRYFVFDNKSESFTNVNDIVCRWKNSYDLNNDKLRYFAEICESPIFEKSEKETLFFEIEDNQKTYSKIETSLKIDEAYFFRVRAYDGLDYSEWSAVHGFNLTSNTKPEVEITSLEKLKDGDIKINFRVFDTKQKRITLRLLYTGGSVKNGIKAVPTLLETPHFFIITDENKGCGAFTWKSLLNEQGDADDFFLFLKANDGIDDSEEFVYGAFSIYNKSIFQNKTSGGSYFLTFDVTGFVTSFDSQENYNYSIPAIGGMYVVVPSIYWGYNNDDTTFIEDSFYGRFIAENGKTFCVKTPQTFYRTIYHHGKYMIYDYEIPEKESNSTSRKDNKEDNGKLEKDPYVIAPHYNPTLNVEEVGVNKYLVYQTTEKLGDDYGKTKPLPNGEWFSEKKEENGKYEYYQKFGAEFNGEYGFGGFVFEDNQEAPQYTLSVDDLDSNGYPKPISYSKYETIGENTIIYIKKYKIENGFAGDAKNFKVIYNNGKYERKYFACRGTPPTIVYENGVPYISYKNQLINKYDKDSEEGKKLNLPEGTIYLPQSVWQEKIKFQHVAVPYYVPSTEAIYRPGDHKAGIVGKGEPIISVGVEKTIKRTTHSISESVPSHGKLKQLPKRAEYVGISKAKNNGIYLSYQGDVYIKSDDETIKFIDHNYTLEDFILNNKDVVIEFNKENITIYRHTDFEILSEFIIYKDEKDLSGISSPYYVGYYIDNEDESKNEIRYFVFNEAKKFEFSSLSDFSTRTLKINKKERLYYAYSDNGTYLIPKDFGISLKGKAIKNQRYLTDKRDKGKAYEKFDFIDYVCNGRFVAEETMYYAGVNGWTANDIVDDYNRAIKFICNIKLADKLQELKIIYLQYCWDSYNMIHWTGNLGVNTFIRIEYTKLLNGKEQGWKDLKFESSIYNSDLDAWLIKPQTYSSLIDNFNYKQFDDNCQYRMRISGVDIKKDNVNSIGPVIASPDFIIDDDSINPFVIEGMNFDPWKKRLEIKFRVDDIHGDLYDITEMRFTTDEKTWVDINLGDITGNISKLKSNTIKNRESNQIIEHIIVWNAGAYLSSSSEIRIQIVGTLSKYNVEFDYPHFSWVCWDNQKSKIAEDEENHILGNWIRYKQVTETDGKTSWEELKTPIRQSGGELEVITNKLEEIKSKYEKTDKSQSYDEWLQSNYNGGITYASRVQAYEEIRNDLQYRLDRAKRLRFDAELFTRKELIKQGFYCNGFENNDYTKNPFEWKVLNLPSKGHSSTIDWGGEKEKITGINGNLLELTSVLENIESLKAAGFEIILPLPAGIGIDDESSPAKIEVIYDKSSGENNQINYLHLNNSNISDDEAEGEFLSAELNVISQTNYSQIQGNIFVISNKSTAFYFTLDNTYALGKYEIFFDCYTGKNNNSNKLQVFIERYNKNDNQFMRNFVGEINVVNKKPIKTTMFYNEENENIVEKLEYSRIVFSCTGNFYFTNFGVSVSEIKEEEPFDIYKITNIIAKGKIGERKTIGQMQSDETFSFEDKYTVYYRFQLDFSENFTSQRQGVPLRDIIFSNTSSSGELTDNENEKSRIRGGIEKAGVYLVNKDVTNETTSAVVSEIEQLIQDSKEIETETEITQKINEFNVKFDAVEEKKKFGNFTIAKSDLPGEWKKKKINNSFPDFTDVSKFPSGLFGGDYYWRFAAYNVVECEYEEISHSIIQKISVFSDNLCVDIKGISNENIDCLKLNGNYWKKTSSISNPYWEFDWVKESKKIKTLNKQLNVENEAKRGLVTFPTDAPRNENGKVIVGENATTHVPYSLDRTKPFVLKDDLEHNYYMFYSKSSLFNKNVIIQSMGKSWNKFGELSQIYPKYVSDNYSDTDIVSIFSPCAVFNKIDNDKLKKNIIVWATAQHTNNKLSTVMFVSNVGKVDFEAPMICTGIDETYHHSVIIKDGKFITVCCKTYLSNPCLFSYVSDDGVKWGELSQKPLLMPEKNVSSPCVNFDGNVYKIYLTEWDGMDSKIISYETKDFTSLTNKRVELNSSFQVDVDGETIVYNNPKNPCVIDDVYMGNKVKRLYYNVDVTYNGKKTSVIKTMFLETGTWQKGTGKISGNSELSSSMFGESNQIVINDKDLFPYQEVRLEVELSEAYTSMPKECILQSDWIDKNNYLEYDAVISPPRNFIYNTIIKEKKYTGE